ncbi:MAG: hypothetical protein P4L43_01920 [Syntrophobacteraceae bacterium]|nr:hypothetical protein [Syntrophobacteraceae bacterium]
MVEVGQTLLTVQGKKVGVPSIQVGAKTLISRGKLLKIAEVMDEEWEEQDSATAPEYLIEQIGKSGLGADVFTFCQQIPDTIPKYPYRIECGNLAVVCITSYESWWSDQITQVSRKNVRRAAKRGVTCKVAAFDDELLSGIVRIYNETPIRQGRKFWHYGKDLNAVKSINETFRERADFIGAYYGDSLIGFMKIVYVGEVANVMQILSMNEHQDKRTTNALIAKAVEVCANRNVKYFVYGNYIYDDNFSSPLIEFKRRMGFEMIAFPIYFVPLTEWGKVALKLNLHHGIKRMIPARLAKRLLKTRANWYKRRLSSE